MVSEPNDGPGSPPQPQRNHLVAARRLLIVMLILLGISTLAAALVPTREAGDETTGTTATDAETATPDRPSQGDLLAPVRIDVDDETLDVIRVELGDEVRLVIHGKRADLVEIPAIGIVEPVSPGSPARLHFLAPASGSYGVRLVEADRVVARIEVAEATKRGSGKNGEGD